MDDRDDRESRTLRGRQADAEDEADRLDLARAPLPGPVLVRTVTLAAYPTTAQSFFAVKAVDPGGAEAEGNTATLTTLPGALYAANAGTALPPSGTYVIAIPVNGRWAFVY